MARVPAFKLLKVGGPFLVRYGPWLHTRWYSAGDEKKNTNTPLHYTPTCLSSMLELMNGLSVRSCL